MSRLQQIPRNALAWIVLSLFTLMAPHIGRMPPWVVLVFVVATFWRFMVYRGRWSFPAWPVKLALICLSLVGIYTSYSSLLGLEPTVALLLTASALKLIELANRKDAYVLLFLGYFIIVTEFLFTQDLLIVLYSFFNVIIITTAVVALHRPGENEFNLKSARLASVMVLQALPLMAVLFFLFPRIGPLWTVPIKSNAASTGMSDFMRPGDVSSLSQSSEVAFRVKFDGDIPPRSELYWRGLVFSRLRDGTWSALRYYDVPASERSVPEVQTLGEPLRYRIIQEPTQQNWLYSLRYAKGATSGILGLSDYRLYSPVEIEDDYLYQVQSWPDAVLDEELTDWRRKLELSLPSEGDRRTREFARMIRGEVDTDQEMIDEVLGLFNTQPFVYTLEPPPLTGDDPMDTFLFETRRGFCEHYAYAFVVMMRAAGIPARVVAGYQGGEINPVNRTVIVHQFDAHAWAEVWLEGQGWVRVDPTAAVSPDRVELGLEQAVAGEGSFLAQSPLSPLRYRNVDWINSLRLRYDALTYRWQSWVQGFDRDEQFQLLHRFMGTLHPRKFAAVLIGSFAVVLIPVAVALLFKRKREPLTPLDKRYLRFCRQMSRKGLTRYNGETPTDFAARAAEKYPQMAERIQRITTLYTRLAYADNALDAKEEKDLMRQLGLAVRGL